MKTPEPFTCTRCHAGWVYVAYPRTLGWFRSAPPMFPCNASFITAQLDSIDKDPGVLTECADTYRDLFQSRDELGT